MMQSLKSFKPCCLKESFCWILTPVGLWNFSAGLDYLIRLQRLDLEDWFVSLSLPVCQLLLWTAANHFHFRVASSTTPGSVSLVHGLTHNKRFPYLFSTPQSRSQQQTEILIHFLKKLVSVNGISGVLYIVEPMWIFSPRKWKELQF